MRNVERITYVAKKLVDSRRPALGAAARAHGNHERKDYQNAENLVNTVHPEVCGIGAAHPRHRHHSNYYQRTHPKTAFHADSLADTREQKSAEKRIQKPRNADLELIGRKAPAADNRILRIITRRKPPENVNVEAQNHSRECRASSGLESSCNTKALPPRRATRGSR